METAANLNVEQQGKLLRMEFKEGETAEIDRLSVTICDQHENCCGIVYDLAAGKPTNGVPGGAAYWAPDELT
jgi:hypothetical protein